MKRVKIYMGFYGIIGFLVFWSVFLMAVPIEAMGFVWLPSLILLFGVILMTPAIIYFLIDEDEKS